jgi:O-antigen ligase
VLTIGVLAGPWPRLGVVAAAAFAAAAMLARTDERRAWAMLGALVLAPVLLLDDVWHAQQLHFVHHHPAEAAAGAAVALAVLAAAAYGVHRAPWVVAPLTALTVPFRIPISTGGSGNGLVPATTNNLLVPLYFVIAASALAWLVPVLWRARVRARAGASAGAPDRARRPAPLLFEKLLAAFVVLYALQSLYSSDFVKALQNEIFFYVPFAVLLARLRDLEWNRELLVRCLLVTVGLAIVFSLIGFVEEATKHLLLNPKVIASNQLHPYFTVNSVFFDPSIFGRYLALVMLLVATVLLYQSNTRVQLAAVAVLAILWGCLVLTLSRSSLVALAIGLAVLAVLRWRAKPRLYGAVAVAVVVLGAVAIAVGHSKLGLDNINHASSGRANLVSGGVHLFGHRPLWGFGSGSFSTEYTDHFPISARSVSDSHNIPITVASEQGIIGLLFYIALIVSAVVELFRGARGRPFRVGIAATFLALVLHTMLYADFLEDPVTWTLLAVGGSLALAAHSGARRDRGERHLHAVA